MALPELENHLEHTEHGQLAQVDHEELVEVDFALELMVLIYLVEVLEGEEEGEEVD